MNNIRAWVKFQNGNPTLWIHGSFSEFWQDIHEYVNRTELKLEWIIFE